ncbi:hypothetical protein ANCCAN_06321 [Ancylostoma caninum]|uniref:Uncharacterized protein n=1 Tax=Ancylostoma caninum TaxID=29170 RepID=A0A368GX97_ANCCA|nr:hypothetical protein ANCCAN_06321 [Ancylostoma caninum]
MSTAGKLMWELNLPNDFDRLWDLRGSYSVSRMIRRHQCFCGTFSEDRRLRQYLLSQKADLVILDHLLQVFSQSITRTWYDQNHEYNRKRV